MVARGGSASHTQSFISPVASVTGCGPAFRRALLFLGFLYQEGGLVIEPLASVSVAGNWLRFKAPLRSCRKKLAWSFRLRAG